MQAIDDEGMGMLRRALVLEPVRVFGRQLGMRMIDDLGVICRPEQEREQETEDHECSRATSPGFGRRFDT